MEVDFAALGRWRSSIVVMVVGIMARAGGSVAVCAAGHQRSQSTRDDERVLASFQVVVTPAPPAPPPVRPVPPVQFE